ncbi:metal ABC transporter substrate-binding protein [Phytoactinopolyspora halotolerans]|uniref:Zinc ABC transporter substrate-binding protein n=1 Tax=Phytoactinopolyspora halotolerans TaxID=1981512 RepID=A0A6L9S3F8_9ACTN|nr:metal ABC transporter substrate-binding protein [Phytoactinopolyspora halotolerans]NED99954.1 zinc ABC transporter substrate-binding protein [Phytoactinopolyspora halotolerans]
MTSRSAFRWLPALAVSGLILASCGSDDGSGDGAASSSDGPTIAAAFYPMAFVAEHVAGDLADVENLTQPGTESHDLELTAQQVGAVADADLVLYLEEFQPAVDEAVAQNGSGAVVDAASVVELRPDEHDHAGEEADDEHDHDEEDADADEETGDDHAEDEHDDDGHDEDAEDEHDHADEEAADEDEHADEAGDDGHDHGGLEGDPHLWLDPTNLSTLADALAEELAEIDPDNADAYDANAHELIEQLEALDEEFSEGLAQCERSLIVVSHEAFGYLADRYGLEQLGVAGLDPDSEPSPARVAEVHDTIEREGVTTVFYERLSSPDVVQSIADDLGLQTAVLDPIEGLTDDTADEDYFSLMRQNLEAIQAANGCS